MSSTYLIRKGGPTGRNYVQQPGSRRSYGPIHTARHYATYEEAKADCRGNETVVAGD